MNSSEINALDRRTMLYALAAVGFVALMGAGMWLAVYSTRYVPGVVNRLGGAAVYLGAVFTPSPKPGLSVVPTASTTIPFGEASSSISTSIDSTTSSVPAKPVSTTAGTETNSAHQIGGTVSSPTLSGLPDFVVSITDVGYLAIANSPDSFIASSTVPYGNSPAVKFTIKNVGTNVAVGPWRFSASIPAQTASIYESVPTEQSLRPGEYIDYTLGFDYISANKGLQTFSITANFNHAVAESNLNNNSASAQITILGN